MESRELIEYVLRRGFHLSWPVDWFTAKYDRCAICKKPRWMHEDRHGFKENEK